MDSREALAILRRHAGAATWIIAYSGGADSTLLLDLALHAAARLNSVKVMAWYLAHGPEGNDPQRTSIMNATISQAKEKLGPRFLYRTGMIEISQLAARLRRSWEHTAALVRRRHLARLQRTLPGSVVFTGHTMSDYHETLALRKERGIPPEAWPALSAADTTTGFFRPLAFMTRTQVREEAASRRLHWFDDPTNNDPRIARNRIRLSGAAAAELAPANAADRLKFLLAPAGPRELRIPATTWHNLSRQERAQLVLAAFRRLAIVKRFTRSTYSRAAILPFAEPPFFVHEEISNTEAIVVFRRGLGGHSLPNHLPPGSIAGDRVTRSLRIRLPYGRKSVTKIFSEMRLSPRMRRLTRVILNDKGTEAVQIIFPQEISA